MRLCPWFWALASIGSVLGLILEIFLCPWPWPRALCPRLHLWLALFDASILLLIALELVPLLCINLISVKLSVKLFECYYGPLVRCINNC